MTRHWWFRFIENTAMIIEDSRQESSPLDNFHEKMSSRVALFVERDDDEAGLGAHSQV